MRIGVNTRLLLKDKLEGIGWFSNELLKRIVINNPQHEFIFFFDRPFDEQFIYAPNVKGVVLKPQARHPFLYVLWSEVAIPAALKKYKVDVFFSPEGLSTTKSKVPTVCTIHDLAFLHYPQFVDKLSKWHYQKYYPKFCKQASKIVAVSTYTKEDVIKQYKVPAEKIDIVYNAPNVAYTPLSYEEKQAVKKQYTDGCEYFLFTSAMHPRKNVINLLKAFVKFKRRQNTKMKLVMVGRMAWQFKDIEEAKNFMPFKEDVVWTGYLGVEALSKLTGAAYAAVYPSLFEGFGIPIIEAIACNVPVITSDVTSMPEVGGDAALYADPTDVDMIAGQLNRIYIDEFLRNKLIKNCPAQLEKFNWDQSAEKLWNVIASVAK